MPTNGLQSINGTSGRIAATAQWPKNEREDGREDPLVNSNQKNQNVLAGVHDVFKRRALSSARKKSRSTSENALPTIEFRATKTRSTGFVISCWCKRKLSRNKRRARVRLTALPIFLLVTIPTRVGEFSGSKSQFAIKHPMARRSPLFLARRKSRASFIRRVRGKSSEREGSTPMKKIKPGSTVCVPPDGDWPKWPCHSWRNFDSKNRVAVCGAFLMVDIGVSSFLNSVVSLRKLAGGDEPGSFPPREARR